LTSIITYITWGERDVKKGVTLLYNLSPRQLFWGGSKWTFAIFKKSYSNRIVSKTYISICMSFWLGLHPCQLCKFEPHLNHPPRATMSYLAPSWTTVNGSLLCYYCTTLNTILNNVRSTLKCGIRPLENLSVASFGWCVYGNLKVALQ
jgi:hypothetical protein